MSTFKSEPQFPITSESNSAQHLRKVVSQTCHHHGLTHKRVMCWLLVFACCFQGKAEETTFLLGWSSCMGPLPILVVGMVLNQIVPF